MVARGLCVEEEDEKICSFIFGVSLMDFNICTWFLFFFLKSKTLDEDILDIYYDNLKVILMWQDAYLKMDPISADCTFRLLLIGQNHLNDTKLVNLNT